MKDKRKNPKKRPKSSWYKSKNCDGILKVNFTPESILKKRIQNRLIREDLGDHLKVKVVEKTGPQMKKLISNMLNPWKPSNCHRINCFLCRDTQDAWFKRHVLVEQHYVQNIM